MPTLSEQLRFLGDEDTPQRQLAVQQARREYAAFWKKWYPFRGAERGDVHGHSFWHIADPVDLDIDPDGVLGRFIKFCQLNPETLVVDLTTGAHPAMLGVLLRNLPSLAGYVVAGPLSAPAESNLRQIALAEYISWDLWGPLPTAQIAEIARKRKAAKIVMLSYWGATYLPSREIRAWISSALTIAGAVYINMPTVGKFRSEVMRKYYIPHLLKLLLMGRISPATIFRALTALPTMVRFGDDLADFMPVWSMDALRLALYGTCQVNRVRNEIMWDQALFMELLPLHK
jgi:hypothetical protein